MAERCLACPQRARQSHHVVYQQHVIRAGGNVRDARDLVPLCLDCHAAHHARLRPIPLKLLPDAAFAFASELLGAGAAYEYLRRRYAGGDARHEALIGQ